MGSLPDTDDPGAAGSRTVDVRWTLADARAFARVIITAQAALMTQPEGWLWRRGTAFGGMALASGLAFLATGSPVIATLGAILGFLLVVAGMWANHFNQSRAAPIDGVFANDPIAYQPRRFTITNAGLVEAREGIVATVAWERILKLSREHGLLIVWIAKIDALPIPLGCFASTAQADAFEADLRARMRAAGNPAADPGGAAATG